MQLVDKKPKKNVVKEIKGIIGAIALALLVRIFVLDNFYVPTGSMIPTVLIWDHLFAAKWSYGYSKHTIPFSPNLFDGRIFYTPPKRGEIIILKIPNDDKDYIKRLIGLPGDKIQVKSGVLHINGSPVQLEKVEDYERLNEKGDKKSAHQYIETLPGGVKHKIIKTSKAMNDNTHEYIVPEKHFFMMGDNRDESGDSRSQIQMGFVPEDYIKGKALFIWFSTDGSARLWEFWKWFQAMRFERFFQPIK